MAGKWEIRGTSPVASIGWFISWKSPSINGWFFGYPYDLLETSPSGPWKREFGDLSWFRTFRHLWIIAAAQWSWMIWFNTIHSSIEVVDIAFLCISNIQYPPIWHPQMNRCQFMSLQFRLQNHIRGMGWLVVMLMDLMKRMVNGVASDSQWISPDSYD